MRIVLLIILALVIVALIMAIRVTHEIKRREKRILKQQEREERE